LRYVIFPPEVASYEVVCGAIHIDGQDLVFFSSQQTTNFPANMAACTRHKDKVFIPIGSHILILRQETAMR